MRATNRRRFTDHIGSERGFENTPTIASRLARRLVRRPLVNDVVDQSEGLGCIRRHEIVALQRVFHGVEGLAGVLHIDFIEALLQALDFLGVDQDVRHLALIAAGRLMHHDSRVRQGKAHAGRRPR